MTKPDFPVTIDEVTPAWLTTVLRASGTIGSGVAVRSLRHEQVGLGVGIMGVIHRVALEYDTPSPGAPSAVVVKQSSTFPANKEQGVTLGLYVSEVRFYRELSSRTALRVPRVFHAELAPNADFVIVMEDLSALRTLDQTVGMTPSEMHHAVVALADLHGPWWEKVADLEWIPSVVHPRIEGFAAAFPMLWDVVKVRFAAQLDATGMAIGDAVAKHYLSFMQRLGKRPWTLLHMDYRCDNFLVDDSPAASAAPLVTLDWQSMGRGPGVYDLAYLIGGSMTVSDRRAHGDSLLRAYHDRLMTHVKTSPTLAAYDFESLVADYRLASLVGMGSAVLVGGGLDMGNERGVALISSMVERHFALPADLGALDLVTEQ
jgi:hypothetical protein